MTPGTIVESSAFVATPILGDEPLYEVVDGQRVELPPMGTYETDVASQFHLLLGQFVRTHQLGRTSVEMLFQLPRVARQRRPDVAFVSYRRWPKNRPIPRGAAWDVVPELAVEFISPSNKGEEILIKLQDYFRAGVQQVWVIWTKVAQIYVYEAPMKVRILGMDGILAGDPVLPGFTLPVSTLFAEPVEGGFDTMGPERAPGDNAS